jgi:hypothetical protein
MANKYSREDIYFQVIQRNKTAEVHINPFCKYAISNNVHSVVVHDIKEKEELKANIDARPEIITYGIIGLLISDPSVKHDQSEAQKLADDKIWIELNINDVTGIGTI